MIRFVPKAETFAVELERAAASGSRVLVFDDQRALDGVVMRMDTEALIGAPARAASVGNVGVDLRNATNVACSEQAQLLTRGRPFIAAFPRVVTHAQGQLALELAQRGIDVIVGSERATFAQLVDDPTSIGRILEGADV
jgi:hypothetical protein